MPAHMTFYHILGTRILTVVMRNNSSSFMSKDNSLRLRVNKFKYKALRLRLKDSRDNKLLARTLMSWSIE